MKKGVPLCKHVIVFKYYFKVLWGFFHNFILLQTCYYNDNSAWNFNLNTKKIKKKNTNKFYRKEDFFYKKYACTFFVPNGDNVICINHMESQWVQYFIYVVMYLCLLYMCYSFIANGDMLIVTLLLNLRKLFLEICKLSFVRQSFFSHKDRN